MVEEGKGKNVVEKYKPRYTSFSSICFLFYHEVIFSISDKHPKTTEVTTVFNQSLFAKGSLQSEVVEAAEEDAGEELMDVKGRLGCDS
ncbi:hypothetical protein L1887_05966 [Cichorium endivia]|nr:hypothetical protein L1887_05966 [Cichorium endivia]